MVLYWHDDSLWSTKTYDSDNYTLYVTPTGVLWLLNRDGTIVWRSHAAGVHPDITKWELTTKGDLVGSNGEGEYDYVELKNDPSRSAALRAKYAKYYQSRTASPRCKPGASCNTWAQPGGTLEVYYAAGLSASQRASSVVARKLIHDETDVVTNPITDLTEHTDIVYRQSSFDFLGHAMGTAFAVQECASGELDGSTCDRNTVTYNTIYPTRDWDATACHETMHVLGFGHMVKGSPNIGSQQEKVTADEQSCLRTDPDMTVLSHRIVYLINLVY